jgi:biotin carboxylase
MVAAGERLPFVQRDINSGNPDRMPYFRDVQVHASPGRITNWHTLVRQRAGFASALLCRQNYDSMIGKSSCMATPVNRRWHA